MSGKNDVNAPLSAVATSLRAGLVEPSAQAGRDATIRVLRERLRRRLVPGVPEIALHLAHPGSRLSTLAVTAPPYWAFAWPGGIALARLLLDEPARVAGRVVVDVGSGCGLVAIAAARCGAARVIASEIDPLGAAAIALNAASNGVDIDICERDLTTQATPPSADLVLGGDVFYTPRVARRMRMWLSRCRAAGAEVLIGDPGRVALPREVLRRLMVTAAPDVGEREGTTATATAAVYEFRG